MQVVSKETCRYCKSCGGCDYIDINYTETLDIKLDDFKNILLSCKNRPFNINNIEVVPSPNPVNYRTRCQLHIVNGKIGFYKKRSHNLIEIKSCLMLNPKLNEKIASMKFPSNYNAKIELYLKNNEVCERIVEKKFDNSFSQINEGINDLLIKEITELVEPCPSDNILELYCGMGNFTLPISRRSKITGIDLRAPLNKNPNPEFIEDDVTKSLKKLKKLNRLESFNKLLLDPPRGGVAKNALDVLTGKNFEKIVYISCNPETLVIDAKVLCNAGYSWRTTKLFDMFPFTNHIESVNVFLNKQLD